MQNAPNGTAAAPPVNTSKLGKAKKGKLKAPLRCVFYGPEGVGKTTLAAHAPNPVWLDAEDGSGKVDVARYPFREGDDGHVPRSYQDILAAIDDLTRNPHDFKTLVLDTADKLEAMLWRFMIERDKNKTKADLENIEDYGYGKGYNVAVDDWRALCARLDTLRATRNMGIIILAHSHVRPFKNPEGDDYERYSLQINEKAAGFLKSWADIVGFCHFDEGAGKLKGASKAKGWSTGRRLINLVRTAAYDAKGRGGMPAELELDPANPWAPVQKAIDDAENLSAADLATLIKTETTRIGDPDLASKVDAAVTVAVTKNDAEALNRYLQDLKRRETKVVGQ